MTGFEIFLLCMVVFFAGCFFGLAAAMDLKEREHLSHMVQHLGQNIEFLTEGLEKKQP